VSARPLIAALAALAALGGLAAVLTAGGTHRPAAPAESARALTDAQRADVQALLRRYLIENPGIVVEALEVLQAREHASEQTRARQAIQDNYAQLVASAGDPTIGPATASVTIVEFFDYQCPYCKNVTEGLMTLAAQDPDLRIVFKELPILGDTSVVASRAALAAVRQGKYAEFHVSLMGQRGKLTLDDIEKAARTVGLDLDRLKRDMQAPEIQAVVQANFRLAQTLGVNGTPAFVIGSQLIPGAVEPAKLRELVARARAGAS
jgi:protein-disulfide isomerase